MPVPASAQVATRDPDGGGKVLLGGIGHVVSARWSFTYPGGPVQFSCVLQAAPELEHPGIRVGRRVTVNPGIRPCWDGELDEPTPGPDGWQITAHGAGTFGGQYQADYSGASWGATAPKQAVDNAIARTPGPLRWVNGMGSLAGTTAWLGQAPDQGQGSLTELLDLVCSRGAMAWQVRTGPGGNRLTLGPLPTAVTRLVWAAGPVARTLAGLVNAVCARYQSSADSKTGAASFATTWVPDDLPGGNAAKARLEALIGRYGRNEKPLDLSNAGQKTAAQARDVACQILERYTQAAFAGPFVVAPGELLTATGTPVSLAAERAGEVVRLLGHSYGGQAGAGAPVVFAVGTYEYDDEAGTASITPMESVRTDWAGLVASMTEFRTGRGDPFGVKAGG